MKRTQYEEDRQKRPDVECPVDGCKQRFNSCHGAGRHLEIIHDEIGRWTSNRFQSVDNVDGNSVVIYDRENGEAWIQSDLTVEVTRI